MTADGSKGRGRPRELDGRKDVCVTLDGATLARIQAWCESLGLTRSEAVRYLISLAPEPKQQKRKGER